MNLIFNVGPSLTRLPPFEFMEIEYLINMDLSSKLDFADVASNVGYGGRIVKPDQIKSEVTLRCSFNKNASIQRSDTKGINAGISSFD